MAGYHDVRLGFDSRRKRVWNALWKHYFKTRISPQSTVLDLGAGYGEFINSVEARRRIALDSWSGMLEHLEEGVEGIVGDAIELPGIDDASIDYAFASNFFEHLTKTELSNLLNRLRPKMRATGRLTVLQPNYRYAYREYFDDYTHETVYSHVSLCDFLEAEGFEVVECHPRFLPLTIKSRLPVSEALIALYLLSPVKPLAKQMLICAKLKAKEA